MKNRLKKILRWPLDAEDTHVYGGTVAISAGAGGLWEWPAALMVGGAVLLFMGLAPHLRRRMSNNGAR